MTVDTSDTKYPMEHGILIDYGVVWDSIIVAALGWKIRSLPSLHSTCSGTLDVNLACGKWKSVEI